MPLYKYVCNGCQNTFETFLRNAEEQSTVACPKCDGKELTRKFAVFGMKSGGKFTSSQAGGGSCGSCSTHNCGSCGCGGH